MSMANRVVWSCNACEVKCSVLVTVVEPVDVPIPLSRCLVSKDLDVIARWTWG